MENSMVLFHFSHPRVRASLKRTIVISVLLVVGVLATYVSGNLQSTSEITPGGTFSWGYGFPLPWITTSGVYCSSPLISVGTFAVYFDPEYGPCLRSFTTSYGLIPFAGDVLFYLGIGYGLILAIRKTWNDAIKHAKNELEQSQKQELPVPEDQTQAQ